jgi:uncharacterized protein
MYRPAAKRRWDYFALPVLYGDQLVGRADARADPKGRGVLVVNAVHQDVPFTARRYPHAGTRASDLAGENCTTCGASVTHVRPR